MENKVIFSALKEFELRLEELTEDYDIETAHSDADKILIETIILLARARFGSLPHEVQKVISKYRSVPKWYA